MVIKYSRAALLSVLLAVGIFLLLWLLKPYDAPMPIQNANSTVPWWL